MEFLHECDLLKIEDVLPFFPDFVTIDHFKVSQVYVICEFVTKSVKMFIGNLETQIGGDI